MRKKPKFTYRPILDLHPSFEEALRTLVDQYEVEEMPFEHFMLGLTTIMQLSEHYDEMRENNL